MVLAKVGGLIWTIYSLAARTLSQADVAALFLSRKILLSDFSEVRILPPFADSPFYTSHLGNLQP